MMTTRRLEFAGWAAASVLLLAAVTGWRRAVPLIAPEALGVLRTPDPKGIERNRDSLAAIGERVVSHDPFRLDRRPSNVAYKSELEGMPPAPPGPPRPALRLTGILGGPPWRAVIEGLPGRESSVVVRGGDIFDKLRIITVTRDMVVVAGMDTTWKLTMRRP
jgi:hypothetical protein